MDKILEGLNPAQKKAVCHDLGPLLIIAGAGTGKTTVLTRRIANLVSTKRARPEEIIALTFTDRAAREMQERVDVLLPYGYADIWISTFHSFGDKILRENALAAGLSDNFEVLTRPEQVIFFREHLFEMPIKYYRPAGNPTRFIEAMLSLFSRAKDEDVGPDDYLGYVNNLKKKQKNDKQNKELQELFEQQSEIARSYEKYQQLKMQYGKVDFGDQVYLALQIFRKHPLVLHRFQKQFKYVLVDEFQDTNYAQFELMKLLCLLHKNITVVGDDDQSIYKFRGAAISNILNFLETYPATGQIVLTQNYRSTQIILDAAYKLIRHNNPDRLEVKNSVNKKLTAERSIGTDVEYLQFDTFSHEADSVAIMILERVHSGGYNYSDFAILVRSNNDADPFLRALNLKNIPWRFSGNQGLYSREEIRVLISFLRVIASPVESTSLYHLLCSEFYRMDMIDLTMLLNYAAKRNKSLYNVFTQIEQIEEFAELSTDTLGLIKKVISDINGFVEKSRTQTAGHLLYGFLKESGYLKVLSQAKTIEEEEKVQNIAKFFEIIHRFSTLGRDNTIPHVVSYLDMLINAGDDPATVEADMDIDAVNVLTVHKAKGLEFRVVFMVSLVMQKFPWPRRREAIELPDELIKDILPTGEFHIQEERRLFYVGMTRAKNELYLTASLNYGGERTRKVSQFVREALDLPARSVPVKKSKTTEAIERFAAPAEKMDVKVREVSYDKLLVLSYFQIDDYRTCPLKYKFVHILRIPVLRHHTVIYGKSLHEAVQFYLQKKIADKRVSEEDVLKIFSASWQNTGFLTREHEEERFAAGKTALINFFKKEEKTKRIPTYIEKEFSFIWENNRIIGRWDRIDVLEKKSEIIDYKSSAVFEQKDADNKAKNSLQLAIYALAFENMFAKLPTRVNLYFLESGLIGKVQAKELNLIKVKELITEVACGIRRADFEPNPVYLACQYCAYLDICPYTAQKR
ncbi:MAG: ATP-dependent DNA helicase [Candidatus Omnitrophota bacterium]